MHCWLEVGNKAIMGADMDIQWSPSIDKPENGFGVTLHTGDKAEASAGPTPWRKAAAP
jgi:PhnB protein